jgi:uncharacterized protein (TIGR02646 family)
MKYIQKGTEPQELTDWKALADESWQPSYDLLSGNEKRALKAALMMEQGFICCYCESRLTDADSHIEHLQPKSMPEVDALSFANMLCSCQSNLQPGEPRHCGNLKGNWYDANLLISPLDPNCESRFAFLANGEILAARNGDKGASETITRLGLGIPKLNALRREAIEPFLDPQLSMEDVARLTQGYLQPDPNGIFAEFFTTVRYLFTEVQMGNR